MSMHYLFDNNTAPEALAIEVQHGTISAELFAALFGVVVV